MKTFKAFTLSEVLITLGIIGIAAAMTLPALTNKYEKIVIESQLKKSYSDFYNVVVRSQVDNGDYRYWNYTLNSQLFVNKYFSPYIKLDLCDEYNSTKTGENCFVKDPAGPFNTWYRQPDKRIEQGGRYSVAPKYQIADGRWVSIQNLYDLDRNWVWVEFIIDVNGSRGHTVLGEDVFQFCLMDYVYNGKTYSGVHLGGCVNGGDELNHSEASLLHNCINGGYGCAVYLIKNNWKFPKDYPIKF